MFHLLATSVVYASHDRLSWSIIWHSHHVLFTAATILSLITEWFLYLFDLNVQPIHLTITLPPHFLMSDIISYCLQSSPFITLALVKKLTKTVGPLKSLHHEIFTTT